MNLSRVWLLSVSLALAGIAAPVRAVDHEAAADVGVVVSEETLEAYVGTYVISPAFELKVWREGEGLVLQATGQAAWPLRGESETVFRVPSMDVKVSFGVNAAGRTDYLVLFMDGRETKAIRK